MKIAILGAGSIGGALARGLFRFSGTVPADITVTAGHAESLAAFREKGLRATCDNLEAVQGADYVFIALKRNIIPQVAEEIAPALGTARPHIVCMAPGATPAALLEWFGKDRTISYAIPNTAAEVGGSMTFIAPVTASAAQLEELAALLGKVGKTIVTDHAGMMAGTAAASCGIAYALRYISASEQGARAIGMDASEARKTVVQTVLGAARLMESTSGSAEDEIDKVTTPGGMTLRGLGAMEGAGFSEAVKKGLQAASAPGKRLVVKVGSNVLTREDGSLDTTRVSSIVDQLAWARKSGWQVVLVTSGAVACGRALISGNRKLDEVQQRQLYSALGQVRLMDLYYKLFSDYGILVGQVLTQKENFTGSRAYENQRGCMEVMLSSGVIPIVNENDTVSIEELMFTDNDELSGLVARMVGAEILMILSNVDGLWSAAPGTPGSTVIRKVLPGQDPAGYILEGRSSAGRGGMASKCATAVRTASEGIRVLLANGKTDGIVRRLLTEPDATLHTEFVPTPKTGGK